MIEQLAVEKFTQAYVDGKPAVLQLNGSDNPSCPRCGHYNALLHHGDLRAGLTVIGFAYKCRDCGQVVLMKEASALAPAVDAATAQLNSNKQIIAQRQRKGLDCYVCGGYAGPAYTVEMDGHARHFVNVASCQPRDLAISAMQS